MKTRILVLTRTLVLLALSIVYAFYAIKSLSLEWFIAYTVISGLAYIVVLLTNLSYIWLILGAGAATLGHMVAVLIHMQNQTPKDDVKMAWFSRLGLLLLFSFLLSFLLHQYFLNLKRVHTEKTSLGPEEKK